MNSLFDLTVRAGGDTLLPKFTLPKLPLPSTIRKLKSRMPTWTLAGPRAWTGGQGGKGLGDKAAGNGSDSAAAGSA